MSHPCDGHVCDNCTICQSGVCCLDVRTGADRDLALLRELIQEEVTRTGHSDTVQRLLAGSVSLRDLVLAQAHQQECIATTGDVPVSTTTDLEDAATAPASPLALPPGSSHNLFRTKTNREEIPVARPDSTDH